MSKKKVDFDTLLGHVTKKGPGGPRCWAARLQGDAKRFVDEVMKRQRAGVYVSQSKFRSTLEEEFGVRVHIASARTHLIGGCSCGQRGK